MDPIIVINNAEDAQFRIEGQSLLSRRYSQPMQVEQEKRWLSETFVRPYGMLGTDCLDDLKDFEKLIWDFPSNLTIAAYDQTPEELAILCGEGRSCGMLSSHIRWIFKKVNLQQTKCINIVLNDSTPTEFALLAETMGGTVERLNFVLSVGKNVDGNVFLSRVHQTGTHWVLASIDLTREPAVLYCDSLGWQSPPDLLKHLSMYTAYFGITTLKRLVMMHVPADTGHTHRCTMDCKNYPIQTCSNAGGLVAVISAVLAALDTQLFNTLCGEKSNPTLFLHYPTRYEKYLRRVLIYWFMKDHIDVSLLQHLYSNLVNVTKSLAVDHSYCKIVADGKRKSSPLDFNTEPKIPKTDETVTLNDENSTRSNKEQSQSVKMAESNYQKDSTNTHALIAKQYYAIIAHHDIPKTTGKSQIKGKRNCVCTFCKLSFASHSALSTHIRKKHSDERGQLEKYPCQCCMCSFSSPTIEELVTHYHNVHQQNMHICKKIFENEYGFHQWKKEVEKSSASRYISTGGAHTYGGIHVSYFHCHQRPRNKGSAGNSNQPCTSFIMASRNLDDSTVLVDYCLVHTGHLLSSEDIPISEDVELPGATDTKCVSEDVAVQLDKPMPIATDKRNIKKMKNHTCSICSLNFSFRSALYRHRRRKHTGIILERGGRCSSSYFTIQELIAHYNQFHKKDMEVCRKTFANEEDFRQWKEEVETSSSSRYISNTVTKTVGNFTVTYFYCNPSGIKHSKELGPTAKGRKKRGTVKIGRPCTSFMTVYKNIHNLTVTVDCCLEHLGHSSNLNDLIIPERIRSLIASSLLQGLEPAKVLEKIRGYHSSADKDSSTKDIVPSEYLHITYRASKNEEDAGSVDLWVKELAKEEYTCTPIIFYKPQNEKHELLKDSDFLLCVQTNFQKELMLKYGPSVICADSDYRLTETGFLLVTLFVSNDHQEAVPVAWAIANREHSTVLQVFMRKVRDSCAKDIKVKMFLSDASDELYNAWCTAFSQPSQRVYCSWHVDKRWKNKINTCFRNDNTKVDVYAILKTLQNETDENTFRQLLQLCTVYLQKVSEEFCQYFIENFVVGNKTFLWAACFHEGLTINVEFFHNVLKSVHSSRNQSGRVDDLLIILLKMANDENLDQLMKYEKGKVKHSEQEIRKSHNKSFDVADIHKVSECEWEVLSLDSVTKYHVCEDKQSPCNCELVCPSCFVCVHMYTCNCIDFLLVRDIICKHIHAVHMNKQMHVDSSDANEEFAEDNESSEIFESFNYTHNAGENNETQRLKEKIFKRFNSIANLVSKTNNLATLKAILESLDKAYATVCRLNKAREETI